MDMFNTTDMFAVGEYFPPTAQAQRIKRYRLNKKVFLGHHYEAFNTDFGGTAKAKQLLYISVNLAGIICKKSADFLFGEDVQVLAGNGDNSKEQVAFDRFVEDNHLNISLYESALSNSYTGDAFFKVRYGQEYGGDLPKEVDPYRIIIDTVDPCTVFAECYAWDKKKVKKYHIAVPFYDADKDRWILSVETHKAGAIDYSRYFIEPMGYDLDTNTPISFSIVGVDNSAAYTVNTGVNIPLIVHIPNFGTVEDWNGIDDLTEICPMLDELNNRLTQVASILDKHSDPAMAVPSGLLSADENGNTNFHVAVDKVFEVMGKDDVVPQYITWDGQLDAAFTEIDKLVDTILTIAEIPAVALGKSDSGTSGSSGLSIKWRMNSLLSKVNRKRQYYAKGLKQVFYLAQALETALKIANYDITIPVLHFNDGLPQDAMEQANIMQIRTGGAKTLSQKSAIMQLNGFTEEQAEQEIERINSEEEATEPVDPSFVNHDYPINNGNFNALDLSNTDKEEAAETE